MNKVKGFIAVYSTTDNDVVKRFDTLEELKAFKPVSCELKAIIDLSKSVNLLGKLKVNWMNKLILAAALVLTSVSAQAVEFDVKAFLDNVHVRVGVGYKTHETELYLNDVKVRKALSARIGIWYRFENVVSKKCYVDVGVDHHSQWTENAPFNERSEYIKQEWFIDGTCRLSVLFK